MFNQNVQGSVSIHKVPTTKAKELIVDLDNHGDDTYAIFLLFQLSHVTHKFINFPVAIILSHDAKARELERSIMFEIQNSIDQSKVFGFDGDPQWFLLLC